MINKSVILFDDIRPFFLQTVLALSDITTDDSISKRTKFLLSESKVENNNITNTCVVSTKDYKGKQEHYRNFSLTKAIEFYNNLK